jgi:hypothetical protein
MQETSPWFGPKRQQAKDLARQRLGQGSPMFVSKTGKAGPTHCCGRPRHRTQKAKFWSNRYVVQGRDGLRIEMFTLLLLLLLPLSLKSLLCLELLPPLIGCRRAGMEASCERLSETRAPMRHRGREGSYATDAKKTAIVTCMSACVCTCAWLHVV